MNGELPLWESTMEQGLVCGKACLPDTEKHNRMTWQQVVEKHNAEFNPSGKVAKRKVQRHLASALVEICKCCELSGGRPTGVLANSIDEQALTSIGRCSLAGITSYEVHVAKDGKVFLKDLVDDNVDKPLFPIASFFKTGAEAVHLIASGHASVFEYALTATSDVLLRPKQGTSLPACLQAFHDVPTQLQSICVAMVSAGLAKPDLHLHKITSEVQGGQVAWTVVSTEKACLKAPMEEAPDDTSARFPPAEVPQSKVSAYVDLAGLKASRVLFAVELDGSKMKGMHPHLCLKERSKLAKGVIAQI